MGTLLTEDEYAFWLAVSEPSIDEIWANEEDDVYAELHCLEIHNL